MRIPAGVLETEGRCAAEYLCLDFWRGSVFLGTYKLPVAAINEAYASQAMP